MSPQLILEQAVAQKINLISVTDHNTIYHSVLACKQSENMPLKVIPGVELTTREEVHLLAYFCNIDSLKKMDEFIKTKLPKERNKSEVFGYQLYYDIHGEIVGIDDVLRQTALIVGIDELVDFIHHIDGIAIPAHIDKNRFSLLSQLGFIDKSAKFDAVEVSKFMWRKKEFLLGNIYDGFPVIAGSDSHTLEDIGLFFLENFDNTIKDFYSLKSFLGKNKK